MSAHFDGGAEIAGRRLREVEVMYVDDPTLNLDAAEDSDDCPPSPPPTYYLRVREETDKLKDSLRASSGDQGDAGKEGLENSETQTGQAKQAWSWRYVNVEKKALLVWNRRGGRLLRTIPLKEVETLRVIPDEEAPASMLEVHTKSESLLADDPPPPPPPNNEHGQTERESNTGSPNQEGVLVLQARSRRETLLWAKVLQENVELMTKRLVPLENLDEETNLSDVQQLAKLLTHQLSELQNSEGFQRKQKHQSHVNGRSRDGTPSVSVSGTLANIPETDMTPS